MGSHLNKKVKRSLLGKMTVEQRLRGEGMPACGYSEEQTLEAACGGPRAPGAWCVSETRGTVGQKWGDGGGVEKGEV